MKKFLRVIVFAIVSVLVKTQTFGDHSFQSYTSSLPYYQDLPQLPYSTRSSDLSGQFYGSGFSQLNQGFDTGYLSQPYLGLNQQYQSSLQYRKPLGYQPYTQTPNFYRNLQNRQLSSQLGNFGLSNNNNNGSPVGGRSASRAGRLQHLYTKAIASTPLAGSAKKDGTFTLSQFDPALAFAAAATAAQSQSSVATPTVSSFLTSTPKAISPLQVSSTISSVPASPAIPSAPPLPAIPSSFPQFKDKLPKQLFSSGSTFSLHNSIPFAEGHSIGNNVAYTYNSGLNSFGSAINSLSSPLSFSHSSFSPFSSFNSFDSNLGSSAAPYSSSSSLSAFNTGSNFHNTDSHFNSLGSFGYDNSFGTHSDSSFGSGYGDYFVRLYNNVYKRDSKSKQLPSGSHVKKATAKK